jgi:hypothetical protein
MLEKNIPADLKLWELIFLFLDDQQLKLLSLLMKSMKNDFKITNVSFIILNRSVETFEIA